MAVYFHSSFSSGSKIIPDVILEKGWSRASSGSCRWELSLFGCVSFSFQLVAAVGQFGRQWPFLPPVMVVVHVNQDNTDVLPPCFFPLMTTIMMVIMLELITNAKCEHFEFVF